MKCGTIFGTIATCMTLLALWVPVETLAANPSETQCDPPCNNSTQQCVGDPNNNSTRCACLPGLEGAECADPVCAAACLAHGRCEFASGIGSRCACESSDWGGDECDVPQCAPACYLHGSCIAPRSCQCARGWVGAECNEPKCDPACENEGLCVGPGKCLCPAGWTGATCGHVAIVSLPSFVSVVGFVIITIASWTLGKILPRVGMPLITGYILVGVLAGPHVLNMVPDSDIRKLDFVDKVALAFITLAAGSKLHYREIRGRIRSVLWITAGLVVTEFVFGTITMAAVAPSLGFTRDMSVSERASVAMLVGTLLVARSPASALAVVEELKAAGPFTMLCLEVTVVSDVAVIFLFSLQMLIAYSTFENHDSGSYLFALSILRVLISVVGGAVLGFLLPVLVWGWQHRCRPFTAARKKLIGYLQVGLFVCIGLVVFLLEQYETFVEPLVFSLVAGFVLANFTSKRKEFMHILHVVAPAIFVAFFTLTGAALALDTIAGVLQTGLLLVVVRTLSIFIGSYAGGRASGQSETFCRLSWMGYITQAGVSLGLAKKVHLAFPGWGGDFATLIVCIVIMNQFMGPPLMKYAIRRMREDNRLVVRSDNAVVFGDDAQSNAVARALDSKGWTVKVVTTKKLLSARAAPLPPSAFSRLSLAQQSPKNDQSGDGWSAESKVDKAAGSTAAVAGREVTTAESTVVAGDVTDHSASASELVPSTIGTTVPAATLAVGQESATDGDRQAVTRSVSRSSNMSGGPPGQLSSPVSLSSQVDDAVIITQIPDEVNAVVIMIDDLPLALRIAKFSRHVAPLARLVVRMYEDPSLQLPASLQLLGNARAQTDSVLHQANPQQSHNGSSDKLHSVLVEDAAHIAAVKDAQASMREWVQKFPKGTHFVWPSSAAVVVLAEAVQRRSDDVLPAGLGNPLWHERAASSDEFKQPLSMPARRPSAVPLTAPEDDLDQGDDPADGHTTSRKRDRALSDATDRSDAPNGESAVARTWYRTRTAASRWWHSMQAQYFPNAFRTLPNAADGLNESGDPNMQLELASPANRSAGSFLDYDHDRDGDQDEVSLDDPLVERRKRAAGSAAGSGQGRAMRITSPHGNVGDAVDTRFEIETLPQFDVHDEDAELTLDLDDHDLEAERASDVGGTVAAAATAADPARGHTRLHLEHSDDQSDADQRGRDMDL